jgi:hypothetical protein
MDFISSIYYLVVLILNFGLNALSFNFRKNTQRLCENAALLVLIIFCSFRFFVGNDYEGYYQGYNVLLRSNFDFSRLYWEPGFYILARISSIFNETGYIFLIGISSVLTFSFLYKALKIQGDLLWGFYLTTTFGLLIMVNDQIRQGLALSIFFYSLKFIQKNKFYKYLLAILIASLFHYSALLLIPIFLIRKVSVRKTLWLVLIFGSFLGTYFNLFISIFFQLIENIPYYGILYAERERFFDLVEINSGIAILFKNFVAILFLLFFTGSSRNIYRNLYLGGVVLGNIFLGFMPGERISFYLYYTMIFAIPLLYNQSISGRSRQLFIGLMSIIFLYFLIQNFFALEKHGAIPYRTLWFENIKNPSKELLIK